MVIWVYFSKCRVSLLKNEFPFGYTYCYKSDNSNFNEKLKQNNRKTNKQKIK